MSTIQISGQEYQVVEVQSIANLANLQAAEPNTAAYVYVQRRSRMYLVRQYKDGSYSRAVAL